MKYICLPLKRDNLTPSGSGWEVAVCPKCGRECWKNKKTEIQAAMDDCQSVCTECALRFSASAEGTDIFFKFKF